MTRVEHRSQKQNWQTPDEVLECVRAMDSIALDPCTTADNPIDAIDWYTEKENGLNRPWSFGNSGIVFANPPFNDMKSWARRIYQEAICGVEIIALTPARPDTRWWRTMLAARPLILFWEGRLKFKGAEHSAPFPSVLWYFGDREKRFKRVFDGCGWFAEELR